MKPRKGKKRCVICGFSCEYKHADDYFERSGKARNLRMYCTRDGCATAYHKLAYTKKHPVPYAERVVIGSIFNIQRIRDIFTHWCETGVFDERFQKENARE